MEKVEDQPNFIDFRIFHINLVYSPQKHTHTHSYIIPKDIFHFFVERKKKRAQNGLMFCYLSKNYEIKY